MSIVGDLSRFDSETFVAFLDISGFKVYLEKGEASNVINDFYQIGYDEIRSNNQRRGNIRISGLFISDCGILFVRFHGDWIPALRTMLKLIKSINKKMIAHDHLTTCSIAFGHFRYQERIQDIDVRKNPLFGKGYVNAFSDNEYGSPKLKPGECRILTKNFPPFPRDQDSESSIHLPAGEEQVLHDLHLIKTADGNHYYYPWMLADSASYTEYKRNYNRYENEKWDGIKNMIKEYLERPQSR